MTKYFKITTDKPAISYKCGETMNFTIRARENGVDIPCKYIKWEIRTDDGQYKSGYGSCYEGAPLKLSASVLRPGFVRITCRALNSENSDDTSFDILEAGAGAEIEKLSYCNTLPDDFDSYWGDIERLVSEFDCKATCFEEIKSEVRDGFKAYDVRISTPSGRNASGVITIPQKAGKFPISVQFQGYSIVGSSPLYDENTIMAMFNAHGIENNLTKTELNIKYGEEIGLYGFSEEENKSNMTTYWRNVMIRDLIAVKFLKTLPEWDGKNLISCGGSQGALQATTVAAHDKDVTFLDILVPWFCNINSVNNGYMGGWAPKFEDGLRYFDTVAQSMRVKCPVRIEVRLGDYVCPPSATSTLYNSFNCLKSIDFVQSATHSYTPHEREEFHLRYDPENPTGEVKKGKYRHFKGNEYEVLDIAYDSENGQEIVVYRALYGDRKLWVRPKYMFLEHTLRNGEYVKRFEYIG